MSDGKIRHMFPGANSSIGFFSYYDYIISKEDAKRIIILKGGPGTGKSTFMKKISKVVLEAGHDVEYMHCSSDPDSLDGLVIPKTKIALIDGTAPHVVDPKNPGVVDEIIHLGDFWDEAGMEYNKEVTLEDNREVGRLFARAYRYIKAAYAIYEDNEIINGWAMDNAKVNAVTHEVVNQLFKDDDISIKEGMHRKLFASAITPVGLKNYLDTLINAESVYIIKGNPGTGTEKMLEKIKQAADDRGYYTEGYYCALNPLKLEHLIIPDKQTSFTTSNNYHDVDIKADTEINLNEFLNSGIVSEYKSVLEYNSNEFDKLLSKTIDTIKEAKNTHDWLETYYIPNMDFEAIDRCCEATTTRIFDYF